MPSPVPTRPSPVRLLSRAVGVAVSSAHGRRAAQELNFLRAHAVQCIADHQFHSVTTCSPTSSVDSFYRRTPGVNALRVTVKLHHAGAGSTGGTLKVSVGTNPAALTDLVAADYLGTNPPMYTSTTPVSLPNARLRTHEEHTAFIDVTGLDPADTNIVRVLYTAATNPTSDGQWSVSLHEVALSTVDPAADPTDEAGVNEAEFDFRNRVYGGVVGSTGGLVRVWGELDVARSEVRRHIQIAARPNHYWYRANAAYGALNWNAGLGTTYDPVLRVRARALYGSTVNNTVRLVALYLFNATYTGLTGAKLKVTVSSANTGGATTASYELQLADTGSAYAVGSVLATLPTDGTDQDCEVSFTAKTQSDDGGGGTAVDELRILALALIEEEA